jgi:hypothetical protein
VIAPVLDPRIRSDAAGDGRWWADRSTGGVHRPHLGIDLLVELDAEVLAPESGRMLLPGWPYANDARYRIVNVLANSDLLHRLYYVRPVADPEVLRTYPQVVLGALVGRAQDVTLRYPGSGMLAHIHWEVTADHPEAVPVGCPVREHGGRTYLDPWWLLSRET